MQCQKTTLVAKHRAKRLENHADAFLGLFGAIRPAEYEGGHKKTKAN